MENTIENALRFLHSQKVYGEDQWSNKKRKYARIMIEYADKLAFDDNLSDDSNLLPCPFCGSNAVEYEFNGSKGYVECKECWAIGPEVEEANNPICDIEEAKRAWNNRHNEMSFL